MILNIKLGIRSVQYKRSEASALNLMAKLF